MMIIILSELALLATMAWSAPSTFAVACLVCIAIALLAFVAVFRPAQRHDAPSSSILKQEVATSAGQLELDVTDAPVNDGIIASSKSPKCSCPVHPFCFCSDENASPFTLKQDVTASSGPLDTMADMHAHVKSDDGVVFLSKPPDCSCSDHPFCDFSGDDASRLILNQDIAAPLGPMGVAHVHANAKVDDGFVLPSKPPEWWWLFPPLNPCSGNDASRPVMKPDIAASAGPLGMAHVHGHMKVDDGVAIPSKPPECSCSLRPWHTSDDDALKQNVVASSSPFSFMAQVHAHVKVDDGIVPSPKPPECSCTVHPFWCTGEEAMILKQNIASHAHVKVDDGDDGIVIPSRPPERWWSFPPFYRSDNDVGRLILKQDIAACLGPLGMAHVHGHVKVDDGVVVSFKPPECWWFFPPFGRSDDDPKRCDHISHDNSDCVIHNHNHKPAVCIPFEKGLQLGSLLFFLPKGIGFGDGPNIGKYFASGLGPPSLPALYAQATLNLIGF